MKLVILVSGLFGIAEPATSCRVCTAKSAPAIIVPAAPKLPKLTINNLRFMRTGLNQIIIRTAAEELCGEARDRSRTNQCRHTKSIDG